MAGVISSQVMVKPPREIGAVMTDGMVLASLTSMRSVKPRWGRRGSLTHCAHRDWRARDKLSGFRTLRNPEVKMLHTLIWGGHTLIRRCITRTTS